jgi:hypothetical protein
VAEQIRRPALRPVTDLAPELGLGLDVQMRRADGHYVAIVEVNGKIRRLSDDGTTCAGLANALVISLAVLLDTEPILPLPPPPPPLGPPPVLSAPAEPPAPTPNEVPPAEEPPPRRPVHRHFGVGHPFHISASVGPALTWGVLNGPAGGVTGEMELRIGELAVSAGVLDLPGAGYAPQGVPGTVSLTLTAGFLRGCARLAGDGETLRLALCADPMVGFMRAEGDASGRSASAGLPWVAVGAGLLFHQHLSGPLSWGARADFVVPVPPARFNEQFSNQNSGALVFPPSPVGGGGSLELRVSIW